MTKNMRCAMKNAMVSSKIVAKIGDASHEKWIMFHVQVQQRDLFANK